MKLLKLSNAHVRSCSQNGREVRKEAGTASGLAGSGPASRGSGSKIVIARHEKGGTQVAHGREEARCNPVWEKRKEGQGEPHAMTTSHPAG